VNAAAVAYRGVIPADRWHEPYMPADELDAEIAAGVEFWGCEADGELLGIMGIQQVRDVDLIRHAYVVPDAQGRGIGSELLSHLLASAERPMLVGTWAAAQWAIRFYERHGFELVSTERKNALLAEYWTIPERQVETSVVLAQRDELVAQTVALPSGELRILQPAESAGLPDEDAIEWAPLAPYWSVLWRSGVALAREVDGAELGGRRVVELGCGLAAPSLAAARAGATVLATDSSPEALELVRRNADENGVELETAFADWASPEELVARAPFDLVLAADVLYERASVALLLSLLPRLGPEAWLADPGRPAAGAFLEQARRHWKVETSVRGVVQIHRLALG
jgi:predicted nicotinamide N-methyase/GNAT superfamily N-acetyltransferase